MDEYRFLKTMIDRLEKSDAFSKEAINKLSEDLEEASKDGRLDTDKKFAADDLMFRDYDKHLEDLMLGKLG